MTRLNEIFTKLFHIKFANFIELKCEKKTRNDEIMRVTQLHLKSQGKKGRRRIIEKLSRHIDGPVEINMITTQDLLGKNES